MNTVGKLTRRLAVLAAAAGVAGLLAACGSTPAAAPTKTITVTPAVSSTPSASTTPSVTPACLSSDLQASLGQSQGAAGTFYHLIVLTNISASACTLYGYPGVSFVTGPGGSLIGSPAGRNSVIPDTLVTLQPGGTASALLGVVDTGVLPVSSCMPVMADWLQIYPPGDIGSLFIQLSSSVCTRVGTIYMHVSAVAAGSSPSSF